MTAGTAAVRRQQPEIDTQTHHLRISDVIDALAGAWRWHGELACVLRGGWKQGF
jgi:hypothetical protein